MVRSRTTLVALTSLTAIAAGSIAWIAASHWLEARAIDELRDTAARAAQQQARLFASDLAKFRLLPLVLGEYTDLTDALRYGDDAAQRRMDKKLESLAQSTGAPAIYLVNRHGLTVSASNASTPESFVGRDYRFRPYFVEAMTRGKSEYYAIGNVSGRPGLFLARRIGSGPDVAGVVVVKVEFDALVSAWRADPGETVVLDGRGIILLATNAEEQFRTTRDLPPPVRAMLARSGQFANATLPASRYRFDAHGYVRDPAGARSIAATTAMPVPGWRLVHMAPIAASLRTAANLARLIALATALFAGIIAALAVWRATRAGEAARDRAALEAAVFARTTALRDEIKERELSDRRFREAREELAQANRLGSLGSITAGIVHEINQPVATIRTLSENAKAHLLGGRLDRVSANLDTAIELTAKIGAITQEMRRFARRGSGVVGPVQIDAVIEGTRILMSDRFRAAGVALDLPPPGQPTVIAGRVRLEQVLVNLLQNALDAVAGQPGHRVTLTVGDHGSMIALTVADDGPGIDPVIADEIFLPFVTGRSEGLGLGLGIVRDIMASFDGAVEVVPSPMGGAAFRVTVARAPSGVDDR